MGGAAQKTKLSITRPIFELEARNFAWKFVWIVRTNYKGTKKYISTKVLITQSFLSYRLQILHGSLYGLSNQITRYKSTKSTKVQKYKRKKYKNTKMQKMQKIQKT